MKDVQARMTCLAVLIIAALAAAGCAREPQAQIEPTVAAATLPEVAGAVTPPPPTATPLPPTATPTLTPSVTPTHTASPTATATNTPTPEPTSPPTPAASSAASAPAVSVAAQPRGAPLAYQPEFPGVAPQGDPPGHADNVNPLSGQPVDDPALIRRRPVLVRYGNDSAARPPSGISQAEVVIEDLMDAWWITRLTAVYLQHEPAQAGPVRSARPVNIEMLPAFGGVLVYSGASTGVTQLLAGQSFDLIHEEQEGDLFYRSAQRSSPHNLYTSIADVRQRLAARGKEHAVDLRGWTYDPTPPEGQPALRVDIPYPSSSSVAWTWDAATGVYQRWVQGAAYTDLNTGQQVGCENVVLLYARHWESDIVEDSLGATAIGIALKGGERVQILRDGRVIEGFWWRADASRLWQFIDGSGNRIPLKPGRTWIQLVPTSYQIGIH